MKLIGTLTKYYPFIDEETRSILDSLMDESSSYYDFVQRLSEVVLENEVPVNLAYLAAVQAWWCRTHEAIELIQDKYKDVPCIKPWGYPHTSTESDQIRYHDAVVKDIEKVMEISPDDWILTELHLLHAHFHFPLFGDIPSLLEPVEKAKKLIAANPLLKCFESQVCIYEGWAKRIEGAVEESLVVYKRGQKLAEAYDESLCKYMSLGGQGDVLKTLNIQESIARFEESYVLVQDLEVPYLEADVLHDSALVFETAGEYDLAISSHLEGIKVLGENDTPCLKLSSIYATLGDGQQALEWINRAFEHVGSLEFSSLYLIKAWALALLNKLEEAECILDKATALVMKSGLDRILGRYYHVSGMVELVKDDYLAALDFFEKSWEIFERVGEVFGEKNLALLGLARAEILLANQTMDVKKSITPGRWLSKLEKHASDRDLPGIRMQAALLKSEFYQNHGQLKDAQATLLDALDITDSLGVATLRKRIKERIHDLNQLIKEAEVSAD